MTIKNQDIDTLGKEKETCFHCGLPVVDSSLVVEIKGKEQAMCCAGCKAVAEAIVSSGMEHYYDFRDESALTAKEIVPDFLKSLSAYDNPLIKQQFVSQAGENISQVSLILEGITCAACVWLNEQYLSQLDGVVSVKINYTTHRASVQWDESVISLSQILEAISRIGYLAHPYDAERQQKLFEKERKALLKKLGVAGLFTAQVMTFSFALYSAEFKEISQEFKVLFEWMSLFLTIPVLFYSAQPFLKGALNDLKHQRAGMDVPVSIGMVLAFSVSIYHTAVQQGSIYFDSVCMFALLLLSVRYIELNARKKSAENIEKLSNAAPTVVHRIDEVGQITDIALVELKKGDTVLVKAGETIPADGSLLSEHALVDESLLSGESTPIHKTKTNRVLSGAINQQQAIQIKIEEVGHNTVLSSIVRLMDDAHQYKPAVARMADRVASYFVVVILLIVALAGLYWSVTDPTQSLQIMIATLVVTCPCALSMATPAAISASIGKSMSLGVLIAKEDALEKLSQTEVIFFDKTGTLTQGEISIQTIKIEADNYDETMCKNLAQSLENFSEHPLSKAFKNLTDQMLTMDDIEQVMSKGVKGRHLEKTYYIGSAQWATEILGKSINSEQQSIYLFDQQQLIAVFYLADALREDAKNTISELKHNGQKVIMLSGDQEATVEKMSKELLIDEFYAEQLPEQKLQQLKSYQQQGYKVAMVGDGINDAPVLAAADCSLAMGSGADLAASTADIVINSHRTQAIVDVMLLSQQMNKIIKQNFTWALLYNAVAIPFAVMGLVPPWLAAIGMSLSSLFVVMNAMRLRF